MASLTVDDSNRVLKRQLLILLGIQGESSRRHRSNLLRGTDQPCHRAIERGQGPCSGFDCQGNQPAIPTVRRCIPDTEGTELSMLLCRDRNDAATLRVENIDAEARSVKRL